MLGCGVSHGLICTPAKAESCNRQGQDGASVPIKTTPNHVLLELGGAPGRSGSSSCCQQGLAAAILQPPAPAHAQQQEPVSMPRCLECSSGCSTCSSTAPRPCPYCRWSWSRGKCSRAPTGNQGHAVVLAALQDSLLSVIWGKSFPSRPPPWVQVADLPLRSL